jgi:hypothetical protein
MLVHDVGFKDFGFRAGVANGRGSSGKLLQIPRYQGQASPSLRQSNSHRLAESAACASDYGNAAA